MTSEAPSAFADRIEDLTPEWLTRVLSESGILKGDQRVTDVHAEQFGTGQVGIIARAELTYDHAPVQAPTSIVVKLPSPDEGSRRMAVETGCYESEVAFYTEVLPSLGVTTPRAFWGRAEPGTGRMTLLLEDLSGSTRVGEMFTGCTVEEADAVLAELVKLQAPLWNAQQRSELSWLHKPQRTQALFASVPDALPAFLERYGHRLERRHLDLYGKYAPKANAFPELAWHDPMVVVHGDFRLDNMLFGDGISAPGVTILDWQWVHLGPPLIDVCLFLGAALSRKDRQVHERDLLHNYHEGLVAGGVEDFTFEQLLESYRECSLYGFLLAMSMAVTVVRTERGDEMIGRLIAGYTDLVEDLDAVALLS